MASLIPDTIQHAVHKTIMGSQGDKIADLNKDTVEPTEHTRITSDYGVKQSNTDHWLSVTNGEHTGPSLLEDAFGREKVSPYSIFTTCDMGGHVMCMTDTT